MPATRAVPRWARLDQELDAEELELLKKAGIVIPEGHLDGYKYTPQRRVVDKQSWEVAPGPNAAPTSTSSKWEHPGVNFELGQGIAYITLNSPQTNNALTEGLLAGLHDACFELHRRQDIRIVVLRAEGQMFCCGSDPRSFAESLAVSDADSRKSTVGLLKLMHYFQSLPQFTIGLAHGTAVGTGAGLLAACDTVFAVKAAKFMVSDVKLGMCPAVIIPAVVSKVGQANAKRIMLTSENLTAVAAKQMGLVTEVVEEASDFSGLVQTLCDKISLCAPIASARSKRLVQNVAMRPLTLKLISYTGEQLADVRVGDEAVRGMVAVQAKQKPPWSDPPIKPLY